MAEVITETILPGTYIDVRAEGLLSIGNIPVGNIGLIGTAAKGNKDIEIISSLAQGIEKYGEPGEWLTPSEGPETMTSEENLTLTRALKLLFDNGARTVYTQRVHDDNALEAEYELKGEGGSGAVKLKARTPGTWGNQLNITVEDSTERGQVIGETLTLKSSKYTLSGLPANGADENAVLGNLVVREEGMARRYKIKTASPSSDSVQFVKSDKSLRFAVAPVAGAKLRASYWVAPENLRKVTFRYGNQQEEYLVPSLSYLAQILNDERNPSELAEAEFVSNGSASLPVAGSAIFTKGRNGVGTLDNYRDALEKLVEEDVQIVIVAGMSFSTLRADILGHVEKTENLGFERIAIVGADQSDVEKTLSNAEEVADKRVVLVTPGLKQRAPDSGGMVELPPYFAAAVVAGKLSSLPTHFSLTNKTLSGIEQLKKEYNSGELKALVMSRVLALQKKNGYRVVKGITTHDEAFKQISIRRVVDYAKRGIRAGGSMYIGRLNNSRVRENLRTTLDNFLASMVTAEQLTEYELKVFATRPMEIRGEVQVELLMKPTFSIDVIRVILNLN